MAFDPKTILKTVAPWIGAAIGGPLGPAAVATIGTALGLDKATEGSIAKVLAGATSEQLAAIRKAEQDFQERMQELGFENVEKLAEVAAADRDSARNREVQVRDNTTRYLAYAITLGFFGLLAVLLFGAVPVSNSPVLNVLVGSLGTAWVGITNYYYGSSAGSDRKTDLLVRQGTTDGSQ